MLCAENLALLTRTGLQIAYLHARLHNLERIIFGGFFLRGHEETMRTISYAIDFWSQGSMQAMFLRHEGYLGAIGAFINHLGGMQQALSRSWLEKISHADNIVLEQVGCRMQVFPLVTGPAAADDSTAKPSDMRDERVRAYWLRSFREHVPQLRAVLEVHGALDPGVLAKRCTAFETEFQRVLADLDRDPSCFGTLTLNRLVSIREELAYSNGLSDVYVPIRRRENLVALQELDAVIAAVDAQPTGPQVLREVVEFVLAASMLGAAGPAARGARLLTSTHAGLDEMRACMRRPWRWDGLTEVERCLASPWKKSVRR